MNALTDLIQRCHQRHKKPLRQQQTVALPAMYTKGYVYQYTVYCANSYPVMLDDLERQNFRYADRRALCITTVQAVFASTDSQDVKSDTMGILPLGRILGIQVYTGMPSECDGAPWHDLILPMKQSLLPPMLFSLVVRHSSVLSTTRC